ncbi:MAG: winged helix-turn-helix transcriptional regulator [Candidatus Korarchaeum sp.]|nr:winged helix-turn-helix transcriptional regulator [Candidatus Korarchaeum sp.]MDW8035575.1 winged helix-turn-helix transcriptional regulator [Candidatus Korarchaeum sp.]
MGERLESKIMMLLERVLGSSPSEFLGKTCSIFMRVVESSSQDGELLIYLFGLKLGEKVGREVIGEDRWRTLSEVLRYMGLAESIEVVEDLEGTTLIVKCAEDRGKRSTTYGFMKGMIAGFISQLSGRYVLVRDLECQADTCVLKLIDLPEGSDIDSPRNVIMEYLRTNPGAHMRQMARDLGMSLGSLRWHLNVLERRGLVRERRKGNMTEFYPSEIILKYHQISSSQGTS